MYPVEPKPPNKKLASLSTTQDIEDVHRKNISGYSIKSMACDPYGHPVFAVVDGKVGSLIVYESADNQVLRKIGAGYHEIESVAFDQNYNFIATVDKSDQHTIVKYNLKGDLMHSFPVEEVTKLYSVTCLNDDRIAVSAALSASKCAIRVYDAHGDSLLHTICQDVNGIAYFIKPRYLIATGNNLVVGDVGTRNLRCFNPNSDGPSVLWTYNMDMPRGMCVDGGGNICACDFRANRVTLLSSDGKVIGHSLTGLSKPQHIAINHNQLFTVDMARSTSYRISTYFLFKTPKSKRKGAAQPEWQ